MRGRGVRSQFDTSNNQDKDKGKEITSETRGSFRGGRFGSGRGNSVFTGKCFTCGGVGNQSYKCPEKGVDFRKEERRVTLTQG